MQEQIHLVEATDEDTAYQKALEFGKREAHSYENLVVFKSRHNDQEKGA